MLPKQGHAEFKRLLETAFPIEPAVFELVAPIENQFSSDFADEYFRHNLWPAVEFPTEAYLALETFACLRTASRLYFLPAYMVNALENEYYETGCLYFIRRLAKELRETEAQRRAACEFLRLISNHHSAVWRLFHGLDKARKALDCHRLSSS